MRNFGDYIYEFAENIVGISACVYTFLNISIDSKEIQSVIGLFTMELIKAIFSLTTAILSAFLISKLKPYFRMVNKTSIKKIFKNVNKRKINK
jgi:hypothetical protein